MFQRTHRNSIRVIPDPNAPIEIQIIGQTFLDVLSARDICVDGIGVNVPHRFKGCDIGQSVTLIISLPHLKSFQVTGKIRHEPRKGKNYFGLEFETISPQAQRCIADYVEYMLKKQSES